MIPFDVDPMLYYYLLTCVICIGLLVILNITKVMPMPVCASFVLLFGLLMTIFISIAIGGSIYTDKITICKHIDDSDDMMVIDTNENVYYIRDIVTKFKVVDNKTVKVKIKDEAGHKWIYSIDSPITCGNQSCGVSP